MAVPVFYNPSNPSEYLCVAGAFIESPRDERRHPGESLQQSNPTQVIDNGVLGNDDQDSGSVVGHTEVMWGSLRAISNGSRLVRGDFRARHGLWTN